ncbi:uncharacterized protein I206_107387 [Kwoniella pini CBS 10737]|uniref:Uncharacterized protein n=1 Tax=Kwoniella pini CBS 10737 TaxID=1296096 RepID=A0A1B9HX53_9TREE|nr:uncharacterized protein I206_05713 [Kwoniella pini CBS 10737]OCF47853.1 hypothetical protein I206_05713 [Kwoniella pini CBS 10737]
MTLKDLRTMQSKSCKYLTTWGDSKGNMARDLSQMLVCANLTRYLESRGHSDTAESKLELQRKATKYIDRELESQVSIIASQLIGIVDEENEENSKSHGLDRMEILDRLYNDDVVSVEWGKSDENSDSGVDGYDFCFTAEDKEPEDLGFLPEMSDEQLVRVLSFAKDFAPKDPYSP